MRRVIAYALIALGLVGTLLAGAAAWALYTPAGVRWVAGAAQRLSDGTLTLDYESGTLADGARFSSVRYASPSLDVDAERLQVRIAARSLARLALRIPIFRADDIRVVMRTTASEPAQPLQVPGLPFSIEVDRAETGALTVTREGQTTRLDQVFLRYSGDAAAHRVRDAHLRFEDFEIAGSASVDTASPHAVDARLTVTRPAMAPPIGATLRAGGDLERLTLRAGIEVARARVTADLLVMPGAALPVRRLQAAVSDFDAHALDERAPRTTLSGTFALAERDGKLAGSAHFSNAIGGPYDDGRLPMREVRTRIETDLRSADLADIVVQLTGGSLSGSAHIAPGQTTLSLVTRDVDLAALHGDFRETRLAGKIDAAIDGDRQSVVADLPQQGMRLYLEAHRTGDTVTLREATLHARGGEARARGTLALDGERRFTAAIRLRDFNPAAWGDFPAGAINATVEGRGAARMPHAQVAFEISKSRLHGAPLSGGGRVRLGEQRVSDAAVKLQLGANYAEIRGAFGRRDDALRVRVDAPQLSLIHPDAAGALHGEATFSGTLEKLQARFDLRAGRLRISSFAAAQMQARGTLARDPAAPLRVTATGSGIVVADRAIARVALEASGSQAQHTATLAASGEAFDVTARARGGWAPEAMRWSGTLLELVNKRPVEIALEAPVPLTAAPERIEVGRVALRVLDGRVEAEEIRYQGGRVSTRGRYAQLPVFELARTLQVALPVGGTLRISGEWSLVHAQTVSGGLTVHRDRGDVTLGPDGAPLELRAFDIQSRIDASALSLQAKLVSALVNAEARGTIGATAGPEPPIGADSALNLDARIAVARLSALAPLVAASFLLDGALEASLRIGGTLAKPAVAGDIRGDRLAFALPPQGVDLKNGTLHAVLHENRIRVESFSVRGGEGRFTAQGTLGLDGADSMVTWQAERLLLLGRPDRRLIVSGKGRAGVLSGKLSLSGGVRADEGYFEIGPDALPEPGPDVVIAGRKRAPGEGSRLARMMLEMVVNFGERLHVRGRGLDTRLTGEITVATAPQGDLRAKGTVRTTRGVYTALGQRLEIERGELIFTGPIDNPGLDILAMRKRQAVQAGVAVTGTLESPLVRVVSEPPVPESEAIAWLVLGHGTADASRGDLAMLPLAAGSLLGKGDSPTLAQRFGLDTLGLSGAGSESQYLAVGKRIADRLYVGFEQSLSAAASVLKLEFDLTDRVLLRAQSGEANSLGIFYRYTFD
jgi:translocation and assembly module TamB